MATALTGLGDFVEDLLIGEVNNPHYGGIIHHFDGQIDELAF